MPIGTGFLLKLPLMPAKGILGPQRSQGNTEIIDPVSLCVLCAGFFLGPRSTRKKAVLADGLQSWPVNRTLLRHSCRRLRRSARCCGSGSFVQNPVVNGKQRQLQPV